MVVLLWLWTLGTTPEPSEAGYVLEWDAPAECPAREDVERAVDRRLGALPPNPNGPVRARGRISVSDGSRGVMYRLELSLDEGDRRLESPRCDELAEAAALIVAIAVNPDAALAESGPDVPDPITLTPPPAPAIEKVPTREGAPRPTSDTPRPWLFVRLAGAFGYGPVPTPAGAAVLAFGVAGRHWRAELEGSYWPPQVVDSRANGSVGGRLQLGTVLARGCGVVGGPRNSAPGFVVAVPLCGGLEIGGVAGRGTGELDAQSVVGFYLAGRVGPHLAIHPRRLRGFGFWLATEATFPIVQPTFVTAPSGRIYEPLPAGVFAGGGVAFEIQLRTPRNRPAGSRSPS